MCAKYSQKKNVSLSVRWRSFCVFIINVFEMCRKFCENNLNEKVFLICSYHDYFSMNLSYGGIFFYFSKNGKLHHQEQCMECKKMMWTMCLSKYMNFTIHFQLFELIINVPTNLYYAFLKQLVYILWNCGGLGEKYEDKL